MKVRIPFKSEFKDVMLNGQKIMTSRTRKMGDVGDEFDAFGATFTILDVSKARLEQIATEYFKEEGCNSTTDFIDIWKKIHPRKGYIPEQIVYAHTFDKQW